MSINLGLAESQSELQIKIRSLYNSTSSYKPPFRLSFLYLFVSDCTHQHCFNFFISSNILFNFKRLILS